jgi:hypothetical protein
MVCYQYELGEGGKPLRLPAKAQKPKKYFVDKEVVITKNNTSERWVDVEVTQCYHPT